MDPGFLETMSKAELVRLIRSRIQTSGTVSSQGASMPGPFRECFSEGVSTPVLLEQLPMATYVRPLDCKLPFTWVSGYMVQWSGLASGVFVEKPGSWIDRVHPDDQQRVLEVFAEGASSEVLELEYRWRAGHRVWLSIQDRSVVIAASSSSPPKRVGCWSDIRFRSALERDALMAIEEEKTRFAADLHDDLCQQLSCVEMLARTQQGQLAAESGRSGTDATDLLLSIRKANMTARSMARGLSSLGVAEMGLRACLAQWVLALDELLPIHFVFRSPPKLEWVDPERVLHIYRIAQEAVHNAIRHAHATKITVQIQVQGDGLHLSVEDNGTGTKDPGARFLPGLGLRNMEMRSRLLNAHLEVLKLNEGGVKVICKIPSMEGSHDLEDLVT
ncbi:PAS domain-containing protein [Verrucomicrobia bacterium]|nr:PAS domain-containing protein [Verrucomicrobiota bacterium]